MLSEAERACPGRDRTAVARNCNIARALVTRELRSLSREEAAQIAEETRYGTTAGLVELRFLWHKAWREGSVHLVIVYDPGRPGDLGVKTLDGEPWQVACVRLRNTGHDAARRCTGTLYLESRGDTLAHQSGPFKLPWVDTAYTLDRDAAESVDVPTGEERSLDVAFSPAPGYLSGDKATRRDYLTSGPIYALIVPAPVRGQPPEPGFWDPAGACIAIPLALTRRGATQAYLPPEEYTVRMGVQPENGGGDKARFVLAPPPPDGCLTMVGTPC